MIRHYTSYIAHYTFLPKVAWIIMNKREKQMDFKKNIEQ